MTNALTPLLPALQTLQPLGLPDTFHNWYASANARQAERLAQHLAKEFEAVAQAHVIDHRYLRSEAFQANVVQAVRAAEIAESEDKLHLIARALAGCVLAYPSPAVDKFQTMRVIEQLSGREQGVLAGLYGVLDPLDPYSDHIPPHPLLMGLSRQETQAALFGLAQLGLLARLEEGGGWQLTSLARQVALLARLAPQDELF